MNARALRSQNPPPLDWQDADTVGRVRQAIASRPFCPEQAGGIELVQTHISSVFLTPGYVFKFKRPIDAGFVDFRTLQARLHYCREEVRLNLRLAPDVYLDVVALRSVDGALAFGKRGAVVDYAVLMKRLPAERMLDRRLRAGNVTLGEIDTLARTIARFHRRLRPARRHAHFGGLETWRQNWEENFEQTLPEVGTTLPADAHRRLKTQVFAFLDRCRSRLDARVEGGFVRNGHGDLRCEHIDLDDPIRIIDCVEFSDRFRYGDTANDLAFLLMDLCAFGYPALAARLLHTYREQADDRGMSPLIPFYACYRAFVRGKVLGMRLRDRNLSAEARRQTESRARSFFALAEAFARQMGPPAVIVMGGLMGSGKSTVADVLARRTGAAVLSSDRIRKDLAAGPGAAPRDRSEFREGIYSWAWTERTYAEMFDRARHLLAAGTSVILDATFSRKEHRRQAFTLAQAAGAEPFLVECVAPDAVTLARLAARERAGTSLSDGRAGLYPQQKAAFEPVDEVAASRYFVVRTDRSLDEGIDALLADPRLRIPEPLFGLPHSDSHPA